MTKYINFQMVTAEEAYLYEGKIYEYKEEILGMKHNGNNTLAEFAGHIMRTGRPGYKIWLADGRCEFVDKEKFENSYMAVSDEIKITQENVDGLIHDVDVQSWENKNNGNMDTVVRATLTNGFTITETSSCVNPKNYNAEIGKEICLERIKNKIWNHLGFLLQTAAFGIKALKKEKTDD